ncbi:MAG: glutaredoxin domain-containing protein [Sciscionella sp.]
MNEAAAYPPITVYWRPGCPFCRRLRRDIDRSGLPVREVNIWEDPSAAASVRSIAGGNETVPTVVVGDHGMVNPSLSSVVAAVRRVAPELPAGDTIVRTARRLQVLRVLQWVVIGALIVASFAADASGHATVSWVLDGVAIGSYLLFRLLRR